MQPETVKSWEPGWFPKPKLTLSLKRIYYDRDEVLTFREYVAANMDDGTDQVSEKTGDDYRRTTQRHLLPAFGSYRLKEITTALVKAFEAKLHRRDMGRPR